MKTIVQFPNVQAVVTFDAGAVTCDDKDVLRDVNLLLEPIKEQEHSGAVPDIDCYRGTEIAKALDGKVVYYEGPPKSKKGLVY